MDRKVLKHFEHVERLTKSVPLLWYLSNVKGVKAGVVGSWVESSGGVLRTVRVEV